MPSASPSSQCGLASKLKTGFSPQVFTVGLSASDLPVGTSSRVKLGMPASNWRSRSSRVAAVVSSSSSLYFKARVSSITAVASWPDFFSAPTCWLNSLRRAFSRSAVVMASRRL